MMVSDATKDPVEKVPLPEVYEAPFLAEPPEDPDASATPYQIGPF